MDTCIHARLELGRFPQKPVAALVPNPDGTIPLTATPGVLASERTAPFYKCLDCGAIVMAVITMTLNPTFVRGALDVLETRP